MTTFKLRNFSPQHPLFIAEAGVNHNGDVKVAKRLIDVAKEAGADVVKFQNFYAKTLNLPAAPKANYHVETVGSDEDGSWYDLLRSQEIDSDMLHELVRYSEKRDILFASTPYSVINLRELLDYDLPFIKLASTDLTNVKLLREVADKCSSAIISTAMSSIEEIRLAQSVFPEDYDLAILQCVGNYPADLFDSNLNVIQTFKRLFGRQVGLSDHTMSLLPSVLAIAVGGGIIEKHFTLDQQSQGPDHRMSLTPEQLAETVVAVKSVSKILGSSEKDVLASELDNKTKLQKSLVVISGDVGELLTPSNLDALRPGSGIPANEYERFLGRRLKVSVSEPTLLTENMLM